MDKDKTALVLKQWHDGDQEALGALLEEHVPWVHSQIRRQMTPLLRSKGETVDYVQDAMIQFLRFAPRFQVANTSHFRAILLKIARNALHNRYDWFTARRREIAREHPLPSDTILSLDPPQQSVKSPSTSAEEHEREAWVRFGMEFLDPEDREMLILRKWDNLSFAEIGEKLDLSPDAARMRHNRAVRRLGDRIWALRSGKVENLIEKSRD